MWEKSVIFDIGEGCFVMHLKDNLSYRISSPFFNRLGRYWFVIYGYYFYTDAVSVLVQFAFRLLSYNSNFVGIYITKAKLSFGLI